MPFVPKNVVIVIALLAAGFFAAYLRFRPHLGEGVSYTDGEVTYETTAGDRIRYAVWDEPLPLADTVNSPGSEGRAATSPDGRFLVFTVGEVGLNADLWLAELVDGEPVDPRPLSVVSSEWDECAPAFSHDALYFASNRPGSQGGLDLYSAPYSSGVFSAPAPLADGINTVAHETDPAPIPGSATLAFASDRKRGLRTDFDLYTARRHQIGEETSYHVAPLDELNTPFEEREPSFTADGRSVVFASNRDDSVGGYDLYRSLLELGAWLAPDPIDGLNTAASERAPLPSRDGFAMLFTVEGEASGTDLYRARSLELFRRPGRPVGWVDLLILAVLLLLALLAYLAKHWEGLEVLYKCFLVSVLAHLLLLWYLQDVFVEGEETHLAGSSPLFQVSLSRSASSLSAQNKARNGELEAARSERGEEATLSRESSASRAAAEPSVSQRELARRAAPTPEAPAPTESTAAPSAVAASALPSPEVQTRQAEFQRRSAEAPELTLVAQATEASRAPVERRDVARADLSAVTAASSDHSPAAEPATRGALEAPQRPVPAAPVPGSEERREAALRVANELPLADTRVTTAASRERRAAPAPAFAMPAPSQRELERTSTASVSAELLREATQETSASDSNALPLAARSFALPRMSSESQAGAPPRISQEVARSAEPTPQVALRTPERERSAPAARETRSDENQPVAALTPRSFAFARPAAPEREELRPEREHVERRAPAAANLPGVTPLPLARRDAAPSAGASAQDWDHTPYKTRFGTEKVRALVKHGGSEETEAAVAAGLEYLASIQHRRGYWGNRRYREDKYDQVYIGKTGLSLLAFLGAGHTPQSGTEYSELTRRTVEHLLGTQDEDTGAFGITASYSHAVATYALAECFALTKDAALRAPLERAVRWILSRQHTENSGSRRGGWGYYYPYDRTFDSWPRTSVTSWQVMALESARLGGIEVPDRAFDEAQRFLTHSFDSDLGAFRYSHDPGRLRSGYPTLPGSTPAGLFALSLLGEDLTDPRWGDCLDFMLERAPDRYRYISDDHFVFNATGNLYFWYYSTLALFRHGGDEWERWNTSMKETLLPAQDDDGSWRPISIYARYADDDDEDRSYTTAMCVLTLEVYYRYFTPLLQVR